MVNADVRLAEAVAARVPDPELPVVTLADLGILRHVSCHGDHLIVSVTPTYSGCPAIDEIRHDVRRELVNAGFSDIEVRVVLRPPWTTDWITDEGRRKLAAAGIAPPLAAPTADSHGLVPINLTRRTTHTPCPNCGATDTVEQSRFGSTACKALYRCDGCGEPFEYIKPL
jgi:ring-1,2-phenylacetyl-CoA epoxidase subunit PaaD